MLSLIVSISGLAAFNAMYVPLRLEQAIHSHPRSTALLAAAQAPNWPANLNATSAGNSLAFLVWHLVFPSEISTVDMVMRGDASELHHQEKLSIMQSSYSSNSFWHL